MYKGAQGLPHSDQGKFACSTTIDLSECRYRWTYECKGGTPTDGHTKCRGGTTDNEMHTKLLKLTRMKGHLLELPKLDPENNQD